MRILVALGGNALLKRGEPMTAEAQTRQHPSSGASSGPDRRAPSTRVVARERTAGGLARPSSFRL